jgi:hypothetical protein
LKKIDQNLLGRAIGTPHPARFEKGEWRKIQPVLGVNIENPPCFRGGKYLKSNPVLGVNTIRSKKFMIYGGLL